MSNRIALLSLLALGAAAQAEPTHVLPLSGMGAGGEKPVYWDFKLDTGRGSGAWQKIVALIERNDPLCRGVVLLGLSAPVPELVESFEAAAPFRLIRGFAVGRTIFHDVARDWLSGSVSDEGAIDVMASRLSTLVDAWRAARMRVRTAA